MTPKKINKLTGYP